jgi:C4-dicarboxylate-specific signal transduction histidine kinase
MMRESPPPEWLERANRLALIARQLSTTVHDVNNMLQVISGHAELLVSAPDANETMLKRGQLIAGQAQRATLALAELAEFAKDAGQRDETVRLIDIGKRALAMRAHALTRLRVSSAVEGDDVRVQGNTRRLLQIALNLIVNAEHALANTQHPTLGISVSRTGDRAALTVEDSHEGALLKPPMLPPTHDGPYGLGIGLDVSKWLAAAQGGTLERTTAPGGGSRVTLFLPVA